MIVLAALTSAILAVVLVLWVVAEQRRAAAERRADELRRQAVALLLRAHDLAALASAHLRVWHRDTPQRWVLHPDQEGIRLAASAIGACEDHTKRSADALGE